MAATSGRRASFDVVVLAASTGGIAALRTVVSGLPAAFTAPVLLVQHRSDQAVDLLPGLLARSAELPVRTATSGPLRPGVTVLPPGMTADLTGTARLELRPCRSTRAADRLMGSAAAIHGAGVLAVVLTGRLDDGAAGVRAVKRAGGRVLVQDPAEAQAPGMPNAALATGCVDHALPLRLMAPALVAYAMAPGAAELLAVPPAPWARLGPAAVPA